MSAHCSAKTTVLNFQEEEISMQRHLTIRKAAIPMILFAGLALSHAAAQSPTIQWMRGGVEGPNYTTPIYTPDGQYLVVWDGYPSIKIFSASTGLLLNTVVPFTGTSQQNVFITSFAVCPSSATPMFAVSGYSSSSNSSSYATNLYSIPGGELQSSLAAGASYLSFAPDCSAVAATTPTENGTSAIYAINLEATPPVFTGASSAATYIPIQGEPPQPLGGPLQYAAGGLTGYTPYNGS